MAQEITFFSSETVSSGGGTAESSLINVQPDDVLRVFVNGDSNSSNLDVILRSTAIAGKNLGRQSIDSSKDLTADANSCFVFKFDIEMVAEIKLKLINNAGSNTTITAEGATL